MGLQEQSFEAVVKDASGQIKDTRFVKHIANLKLEFLPNARYLTKLNNQHAPWKIPYFHGQWLVSKQ